eukprot:1461343-Heterocapsa_arctica.AAC.1
MKARSAGIGHAVLEATVDAESCEALRCSHPCQDALNQCTEGPVHGGRCICMQILLRSEEWPDTASMSPQR